MFWEETIFEETPENFSGILSAHRTKAVEARNVTFNQIKGHSLNVHYSGFSNQLQTKSGLNISIPQGKMKHKCLPLDTM